MHMPKSILSETTFFFLVHCKKQLYNSHLQLFFDIKYNFGSKKKKENRKLFIFRIYTAKICTCKSQRQSELPSIDLAKIFSHSQKRYI